MSPSSFCLALPVLVGVAGLGIDSAAIPTSGADAVGRRLDRARGWQGDEPPLEDLGPLKESGWRAPNASGRGGARRPSASRRDHPGQGEGDKPCRGRHGHENVPASRGLGGSAGQRCSRGHGPRNGTALRPEPRREASRALDLDGLARVTATDCVIQSNSKDCRPQCEKAQRAHLQVRLLGRGLRRSTRALPAATGDRLSRPRRSAGDAVAARAEAAISTASRSRTARP